MVHAYRNEGLAKIDLLFVIDDSPSMADKQQILRDALPDVVYRLINPRCVDPITGAPLETPPNGTGCPDPRARREFQPIRDIHVGVVTSSLGGHGTSCPVSPGGFPDDRAHLLGTLPRYSSPGPPSLDPAGFLVWRPEANPGQDSSVFAAAFQDMVVAASQSGCGFEAPLESWYRFLIDPAPHLTVTLGTCPDGVGRCAVPSGVDEAILAQRRAFLRPDSLVAVVMVTDENDCSIQDSGQGFLAVESAAGTLSVGSATCDSNPNDPCCYPCAATGTGPAAGVPPGCTDTCAGRVQTTAADAPSLRCFDMKRRFGEDYLYPTARYVNALGLRELCTSVPDLDPNGPGGCPDDDGIPGPDLFPNPLYSDLTGSGALPRANDLVFLTGIVGVPWQDIRDPGSSDATALTYLQASDVPWGTILGDTGAGTTSAPVAPADTHMIESVSPRSGLPAPDAAWGADAITGHEYSNTNRTGFDGVDLQYACTFPLRTPVVCTAGDTECDCDPSVVYASDNPFDRNPLCQAPDGTYGSIQYSAKAYPGLRELEVLRGFGANATVASLCATNLTDPVRRDYGYRPTFDAVFNRLSERLGPSCLPSSTTVPRCTVIEATPGPAGCDPSRGRRDIADVAAVETARTQLRAKGVCDGAAQTPCDALSFCWIEEAAPTSPCKTSFTYPLGTTPGWCLVDDDPEMTGGCDRALVFMDPLMATPAQGSYGLISCTSD